MTSIKIIGLALLTAALVGGMWTFVRVYSQKKFEEEILSLAKVSAVEERIGGPSYVISEPGGWFGRGMVDSVEFEDGVTLRVYLIQKVPPRFLVVKVASGSDIVEISQIETS